MIIEMSDRILSRNIRYLRKKRKLSQAALAELSGIPVSELRDIEKSSVPPRVTADALCHICAALGVPVEVLVHTDLEQEAPPPQD